MAVDLQPLVPPPEDQLPDQVCPQESRGAGEEYDFGILGPMGRLAGGADILIQAALGPQIRAGTRRAAVQQSADIGRNARRRGVRRQAGGILSV